MKHDPFDYGGPTQNPEQPVFYSVKKYLSGEFICKDVRVQYEVANMFRTSFDVIKPHKPYLLYKHQLKTQAMRRYTTSGGPTMDRD